MRTLRHESSVYREISLQILMMLGEELQTEGSHFRDSPEDVVTLIYAVQHLDEIAVLADASERAHEIAKEGKQFVTVALKVSA